MNNKQKALQINPNLKVVRWYLPVSGVETEGSEQLKKGNVYKIVDNKTKRQTCYNFQTSEKAWSSVVRDNVASDLAKLG
jgi:hypothetical protein